MPRPNGFLYKAQLFIDQVLSHFVISPNTDIGLVLHL